MLLAGRAPEVVEADLVEDGRRLVAGDVAAELRARLVRVAGSSRSRSSGRSTVLAARAPRSTGMMRLVLRRDRVEVRRRARGRGRGAGQLGVPDDALEQELRALRTVARRRRRRAPRATRVSPGDLPRPAMPLTAPDLLGARPLWPWTRRARPRQLADERGRFAIARSGEPARSVSDDTWMCGIEFDVDVSGDHGYGAGWCIAQHAADDLAVEARRVELAFAGDDEVGAASCSRSPTASATTSKPERSVAPSAARPPASPPAAPRARHDRGLVERAQPLA